MFNRIVVFLGICKSLLKTMFQLFYGIWKVTRLDLPVVTIFGGSRLSQDNKYAQQAHELAHKLIRNGMSVITGGGPGIMRAASCGASHEMRTQIKEKSIGITVKGLPQEEVNECAQEYLIMDHFFARKWLMINYAIAFAVFPGGFGTLDELFEVLTLMQTKKLQGMIPVVLIGKEYWEPLSTWIDEHAVKLGLVLPEEQKMYVITNNIDEAVSLLKQHCAVCGDISLHQIKKKTQF